MFSTKNLNVVLFLMSLSGCQTNKNQADSDLMSVSTFSGQKKIFSTYRMDKDSKIGRDKGTGEMEEVKGSATENSNLLWCAYQVEDKKISVINEKAWSTNPSNMRGLFTASGVGAVAGGGAAMLGGCTLGVFTGNPVGAAFCIGGVAVASYGVIATPIGMANNAIHKDGITTKAWQQVTDLEPTQLNHKDYEVVFNAIKQSGNSKVPCEPITLEDLQKAIDKELAKKSQRP